MLASKLLGAGIATAGISYVAAAQTQNTATGFTLVINKPTGTVQGDIMVAVFSDSATALTWTSPANWTEIIDQGVSPSLSVAYRVAGASEGSSYTFTASNNRLLAGAILTFRGAAYNTIGTISPTTSSGVQTAPAITLASNKSAIIACFFSSSASRTWSSPSSGLVATVTESDANTPSFQIYRQLGVSSGSTGTKSATQSGTTGNHACLLIGLKPV